MGVALEEKVSISAPRVQLRVCEVLRDHGVATVVLAKAIIEAMKESFIMIGKKQGERMTHSHF